MSQYIEDPSSGGGIGAIITQVAKQVKPQPSRSRRTSYRSGGRGYSGGSGYGRGDSGGGGNYSGGGGGGGYSAPKPPSINSYLGTDSIYQNAVRGGKKSLADFISDINRRRGEAGTQFNQTSASMERDRTTQLDKIRQEFASRGLINSGLFGQEQGEFQKSWSDQMNALKQQQAALLADLLSQQNNYQRENQLALEQAKQEALLRRAQQYNIS